MGPSQSCGTCANCDREKSERVDQGECRLVLHSYMLLHPNALRTSLEPRTFSYYPVVELKDRGCSHYTPALEVSGDA